MRKFLLFWPHLKAYRGRIALVLALTLAVSALEGVGVGLLYPLVEALDLGEDYARRGSTAAAAASALGALGLSPSLGAFLAVIFGAIALSLALRQALAAASAAVYCPLTRDLRGEGFRRILGSHLFHFYATPSASVATTLEAEAGYVAQTFQWAVNNLALLLTSAIYALLLLLVSWPLTALVVLTAGVRWAVSQVYVRRIMATSRDDAGLVADLRAYLTALHQGIDVVKTSGTEEREAARFDEAASRLEANGRRAAWVAAANVQTDGLLGAGLLCALVYLAVERLGLRAGPLLPFLFIITRLIPKVTAIFEGQVRMAEFMARVLTLPDLLYGQAPAPLRWGGSRKKSFEDKVRFESVSFTYPGRREPAVIEASFDLPRGGALALAGESGAGKTTLARLLIRLFDPTSGRVLIDGTPLPELAREDWIRLVSVVSQDAFIFDDTVEGNVRYGAPDASEEDYRRALKLARADEFVAGLPQKDQTPLGERGLRLSGGQRQRIAIARAFLRDAPILVLDEATSSLDASTEKLIQDAIDELAKGRTLLVIAHRLSTIRRAGRILVLEGGRIAEQGTHEELLARGGAYRRFHDLQRA